MCNLLTGSDQRKRKKNILFPPSRNRAGDLSVICEYSITAERHIQLDHRGFKDIVVAFI